VKRRLLVCQASIRGRTTVYPIVDSARIGNDTGSSARRRDDSAGSSPQVRAPGSPKSRTARRKSGTRWPRRPAFDAKIQAEGFKEWRRRLGPPQRDRPPAGRGAGGLSDHPRRLGITPGRSDPDSSPCSTPL
jgi:hypothetical protein